MRKLKLYIITTIHNQYGDISHDVLLLVSVQSVNEKLHEIIDSINKTLHNNCKHTQDFEYKEDCEEFILKPFDYYNGGEWIISVTQKSLIV
jgi:hypothetical protein